MLLSTQALGFRNPLFPESAAGALPKTINSATNPPVLNPQSTQAQTWGDKSQAGKNVTAAGLETQKLEHVLDIDCLF